MPATRIPKKIRGSKVVFYPKHLLPKDDLRYSFISLTSSNPKERNRGMEKIMNAGKLKEAVEFVRKFDFSRIPLSYSGKWQRGQNIQIINRAISKKRYFLHRGLPVYISKSKLRRDARYWRGRVIISPKIKGKNKQETQIFREIVAEHEFGHFVTCARSLHKFPILMELRYAIEKGKINEWMKFGVTLFMDQPQNVSDRITVLRRYYPKIAKKIEIPLREILKIK